MRLFRRKRPTFVWRCDLCPHTEEGPESTVRRYCVCGNYMVKEDG